VPAPVARDGKPDVAAIGRIPQFDRRGALAFCSLEKVFKSLHLGNLHPESTIESRALARSPEGLAVFEALSQLLSCQSPEKTG